MKLTIGLSAALASFAAAAQEAAEHAAQVYILRGSHPSSATESITPLEARLILDQRLAPDGEGPSFRNIPDTASQERIVDLINKYGKEPVQLFTEKDAVASPNQLVVVVQGMPRAEYESHFGWRLHTQPDFTVSNTQEKLGQNNFYDASIAKQHGCSLSKAVDPSEESCWNGKSTLATYDRSEDSDHPTTFLDELPQLEKLAESGKLETTLVFLPEGEASNSKLESDDEQELRRRQAETVITSVEENNAEPPAETSSVSDSPVFSSVPSVVPTCFQSEDSCIQGTANCSGHGLCQNKYAKNDGSDGKDVCYSCHCLSTVSEKGSVTHWAGGACSKQDISVQFWLFAGFTIAMVTVLYLAIGMLFSVGEEKLPGVIGAGVSRSK